MVLERFDSAPGNELLILKTDIMETKRELTIKSIKSNLYCEDFPEGTTPAQAVDIILNNKDAIKAWIEDYEHDMQIMDGDFYCDDLNEEYKIAIEYLNHRLTELN